MSAYTIAPGDRRRVHPHEGLSRPWTGRRHLLDRQGLGPAGPVQPDRAHPGGDGGLGGSSRRRHGCLLQIAERFLPARYAALTEPLVERRPDPADRRVLDRLLRTLLAELEAPEPSPVPPSRVS
jgi:hypothetical protein